MINKYSWRNIMKNFIIEQAKKEFRKINRQYILKEDNSIRIVETDGDKYEFVLNRVEENVKDVYTFNAPTPEMAIAKAWLIINGEEKILHNWSYYYSMPKYQDYINGLNNQISKLFPNQKKTITQSFNNTLSKSNDGFRQFVELKNITKNDVILSQDDVIKECKRLTNIVGKYDEKF